MIPVCIFTFADDGPAALMAADAAATAGLGPVFLEVDAAAPFTEEMASLAERQGYIVTLTDFPRTNAIRGLPCYRGLLASYLRIFATTGATHLVKLDSDTVVNLPDRIRQAVEDDVAAAALCTPEYPFYGCCMVLARRAAEAVSEFVTRWNGVPGYSRRDMSEDIATGDLVDRMNIGQVRRWRFNLAGGFAAGWRFGGDEKLETYAERFDVVTFGNRHLLRGKPCEKRDQVAAGMYQFIKALRRRASAPMIAGSPDGPPTPPPVAG